MLFDLMATKQKSFYGKAQVELEDNGAMVLLSYNTPIVRQYPDGTIKRLYKRELSHTTTKHLIEFCGLHKKDFEQLEFDE